MVQLDRRVMLEPMEEMGVRDRRVRQELLDPLEQLVLLEQMD